MAKNSIQILASAVAKKHKITIGQAQSFIEAIFDIVTEELKNNNQVKIKGLGTFKVLKVKPRESVNVNTGERVLIEGHDKISFTPDATMKELVNKPFSQFETVVLNDGVDFENEKDPEEAEDNEEILSSEEAIKIEDKPEKEIEEKVEEKSVDVSADQEENENANKNAIEESVVAEKQEEAEVVKADDEAVEKEAAEEEKDEVKDNVATIVGSLAVEKDANTEEEAVNIEEKQPAINTPFAEIETENKASDEEKQHEEVSVVQAIPSEEDESSPVSFDDDDDESPEDRTLKTMLKVIGVVVLVIIFFLIGRAIIKRGHSKKQIAKTETPVPASKPATQKAKPVAQAQTPPPIPQASVADEVPTGGEPAKYASLSNDPRIRYGAYNIIGIAKVVVLKKGETMASYSRKTLGRDMIGYFQVLNKRNSAGPGDTIKVPKVEYRPQYQNR